MEKRNKQAKQEVELWAVPTRVGDGCYPLAMLGMAIFVMVAVAVILWLQIQDTMTRSAARTPEPTSEQSPTAPVKRTVIIATPAPPSTALPTITAYPTYTPQATYTSQATYTRGAATITATATAEKQATTSATKRAITITATAYVPTKTPRATNTRSKERLVTPTPRTLATTLYLLKIPTLTPTRAARHTETAVFTKTPIITASPMSPSATPAPVGTPAWTMEVRSYGQDRWGAPSHANGCDGPYNNKRPTQRFRMEVVVRNNSDRALFTGWGPRFSTAQEAQVLTCAMEHLNHTLLPGDTRRVTFFTHFAEDDRLTRIVMDELHYRWEVCQNAAGEWETCAGAPLAELPTAAVAAPTPAPDVPQPYAIEIKQMGYDLWGRPRAENGCDAPYENKDPVRRFTMVTQVTNNSAQPLPEGWKPEFYTAQGKAPPSCVWNNDSTALKSGETRELTFFTHVEQDDWVSRAVVDTMNYLWVQYFRAAEE